MDKNLRFIEKIPNWGQEKGKSGCSNLESVGQKKSLPNKRKGPFTFFLLTQFLYLHVT